MSNHRTYTLLRLLDKFKNAFRLSPCSTMMTRVVEVEIIQFTLDDFDLFSSAEHEDEQTKCNVKYDSFCSFQCAPMINLSTQS